jgi:hypothetical protein
MQACSPVAPLFSRDSIVLELSATEPPHPPRPLKKNQLEFDLMGPEPGMVADCTIE